MKLTAGCGLLGAMAAASLLVSCSSLRRLTTAATNVVTRIETGPTRTNIIFDAGVTVTQILPPLVLTNFITNITFTVNTNITQILDTARAINTVNPTPTAPLISVGLGIVSAGLAWYARLKTNKAQATQDLLDTVIAGVESTGHAETKAAIQKTAKLWGTQTDLDKRVHELTA